MSVCGNCHRDAPDGALFCSFCGATIKPATGAGEAVDPLIGKTLAGKYFIHQLLGHGGMGDVYKATHLTLDRPVVLKLLKKLFHTDPSLVQRFHREARAASRLNHPNSITIIDFGQADDGTLFMAMEFLAGRSLERVIVDDFPLAEGRVIHIVAQILAALGEAHALGIIHRDLKPANVMVEARRDEPDFVKVLDFGIAKLNEPGQGGAGLTQAGIVCGTPGYMSPEQVHGEELDARSDLYAVGVILYEMITGVLPFESDTPMGLVTRHLVEDPPPMAERRAGVVVSPELEALVMRALARSRNDRFASTEEMRAALLRCGAPVPQALRPTPAPSSTMIFDASTLGAPAAGRPQTGRSGAVRHTPSKLTTVAPELAGVEAVPPPAPAARKSTPAAPVVRTPAPAKAAPAAKGTPAPAVKGTPAPAAPKTPAAAKPRTPAPAPARKPPTGPAARAPVAAPPAPVIRHEMDEEDDAVEAEAPAPPPRSKVPLFAAAGAAAVVLAGLAAWGLTRDSKPEPAAVAVAPAAAPTAVKPPVTAPAAAAVPVAPPPPAEASPAPVDVEPPPSAPVQAQAEPAPRPAAQPLSIPAPPVAKPPPPTATKVAAASPASTKGIRLVKPELNAIPTPTAATGEGVLAVMATPWAEVSIDGRDIGETPREVLLGAGTYRLRASHPDLGIHEAVVKVRAGKRQVWNPTFAK